MLYSSAFTLHCVKQKWVILSMAVAWKLQRNIISGASTAVNISTVCRERGVPTPACPGRGAAPLGCPQQPGLWQGSCSALMVTCRPCCLSVGFCWHWESCPRKPRALQVSSPLGGALRGKGSGLPMQALPALLHQEPPGAAEGSPAHPGPIPPCAPVQVGTGPTVRSSPCLPPQEVRECVPPGLLWGHRSPPLPPVPQGVRDLLWPGLRAVPDLPPWLLPPSGGELLCDPLSRRILCRRK